MRSVVRRAFVVVAMLSATACSGASRSSTATESTSTLRPVATAMTTAPTSTTTAKPQPDRRPCARTLQPVSQVYDAYNGPLRQGESLDVPKTDKVRNADGTYSFVTRDGSRIPETGTTLTIDRPDGALVLRPRDETVYTGDGQWDMGDLDGDGREDFVAYDYTARGDDVAYFISGATKPGTYRVDTRGASMRVTHGVIFHAVGDQNGDGAADVVFEDALYSARTLFAAKPGKTVTLPRPLAAVPNFAAALALDAGRPPVLVEASGSAAAPAMNGATFEVKVLGAEMLCLLTGTVQLEGTGPAFFEGSPGIVHGDRVGDHRFVTLEFTSRSGFTRFRWDIDGS